MAAECWPGCWLSQGGQQGASPLVSGVSRGRGLTVGHMHARGYAWGWPASRRRVRPGRVWWGFFPRVQEVSVRYVAFPFPSPPSFSWLGCRAVLNPGFLHTAVSSPFPSSYIFTTSPLQTRQPALAETRISSLRPGCGLHLPQKLGRERVVLRIDKKHRVSGQLAGHRLDGQQRQAQSVVPSGQRA